MSQTCGVDYNVNYKWGPNSKCLEFPAVAMLISINLKPLSNQQSSWKTQKNGTNSLCFSRRIIWPTMWCFFPGNQGGVVPRMPGMPWISQKHWKCWSIREKNLYQTIQEGHGKWSWVRNILIFFAQNIQVGNVISSVSSALRMWQFTRQKVTRLPNWAHASNIDLRDLLNITQP